MDSNQQLEYLDALGIKVWVPKDLEPVAETISEPAPAVSEPPPAVSESSISEPAPAIDLTPTVGDVSDMDWSTLKACVQVCENCRLHSSRTQTVFGVGNEQANLMVIGEAPGADEDKQGEPFVGRAGKLLDEMLFAINNPRETVYIANIVKCRPPENRNPQHDEALQCSAYLQRQIELTAPKVILAVGKVAAQNLLNSDLPIGKMRGQQFNYEPLNIPVIVTYHPAYLLRSPKEKAKVWQDLKLARELL